MMNLKKAILEEIDFTWKGTGAIGVIGESGAGKSTLIDVLAGFFNSFSWKDDCKWCGN